MGDDSGKLVIALSRSHNALFTLIEKNIKGFGLTVSEFGVLEALLHKGELPVQQLRKKVLVTSGSMTYIVDKLQEKGYVKRYKCKEDARIWFVRLTDIGQEFIAKIYQEHEIFLKEILSDIAAEDKEGLIQALFQLKDSLDKKSIE